MVIEGISEGRQLSATLGRWPQRPPLNAGHGRLAPDYRRVGPGERGRRGSSGGGQQRDDDDDDSPGEASVCPAKGKGWNSAATEQCKKILSGFGNGWLIGP